jgi:hypothetical protein
LSQSERVTITLKAGTGFDAPWIVIHGDDVTEAGALLQELRSRGVFAAVRAAGIEFASAELGREAQAVNNVQRSMGGQVTGYQHEASQGSQESSYRPPYQDAGPETRYPQGGSQQLPQGYEQTCAHGPMTYIAQGKYGPFWACRLERNDPNRCKPRSAR